MKLTLKQIKLEQKRYRNRQNPKVKDSRNDKMKKKYKNEYWKRIRLGQLQ